MCIGQGEGGKERNHERNSRLPPYSLPSSPPSCFPPVFVFCTYFIFSQSLPVVPKSYFSETITQLPAAPGRSRTCYSQSEHFSHWEASSTHSIATFRHRHFKINVTSHLLYFHLSFLTQTKFWKFRFFSLTLNSLEMTAVCDRYDSLSYWLCTAIK